MPFKVASDDVIRAHLQRIVESPAFARSPQAARFLSFVVCEALSKRSETLKAYTIGVQALGIVGPRSDPDGVARMQASRTRRLLATYYEGLGRGDPLRIVLPTGSYVPSFVHLADDELTHGTRLPLLAIESVTIRTDHPEWSAMGEFTSQELCAVLERFDGLRVRLGLEGAERPQFALALQVLVREGKVRAIASLREVVTSERLWYDRFDGSIASLDGFSLGDLLANEVASRVADPTFGAVARVLRRRTGQASESNGPFAFCEYLASYSASSLRRALHSLQFSLLRDPESTSLRTAYAHANAAMFAISTGDRIDYLDVAEEQIRHVLASAPTSAHARFVKGFVHFHRREREAARHELRRAAQLNPLQLHSCAGAGMLLALMNDWKEGLGLVDSAYTRYPDAPGFFHLAHCTYHFFEGGDPEEAYRRSELFDTPDLVWTPLLKAVCLALLGRRYEASRAVSELIGVEPDFAKRARTYLSGYLYAESVVEAFISALREAGLRIGPVQSSPGGSERRLATHVQIVEDNEIRVGVLHSLTGTMAICERQLVHAAKLAIDEINATGGVLGRHVTALVEDGESRPDTFAAKARKLLVDDRVATLFGCWTSACRKAVRPVVEHFDSLLWYPVQYEGLERSRNIIYTGSCLNQQIEPATRWAIAEGKRRFFLVGSDYVFPRTANYLIRAILEGAGCEVLGEEYRPLGAGEFREIADRIRRLGPDFVFNTVNGEDNIALFHELANAGLSSENCPVMSFSMSELELPGLEGGANGHFACWSYFQSVDAPENLALLRRFRERYGEHEVLSDPAVTAYAQVHLWRQVAQNAGSFATDAMLQSVVGGELSLAGDTLEVRSNNHVKRRALIGRIRPDNQFDVVWGSSEAITPQPWLGVEESGLESRELLLDTLGRVPDIMQQKSALEREVARHVATVPASSRRFKSDRPPSK